MQVKYILESLNGRLLSEKLIKHRCQFICISLQICFLRIFPHSSGKNAVTLYINNRIHTHSLIYETILHNGEGCECGQNDLAHCLKDDNPQVKSHNKNNLSSCIHNQDNYFDIVWMNV